MEKKAAKKPKKSVKEVFTSEDVQEVSSQEQSDSEVPMEESQPRVPQPQADPENRSGKKLFLIALPIVFLVGVLVGGAIMYREGVKKQNESTIQATPTPPAEPTETPTPKEIDVSKHPITILNGSGIAGQAAKVKEILEEQKFVVASTGNADRSDYKETVIQAKKSVESEFLEKLKKTLEEAEYIVAEIEELSDTEESDVTIFVGSAKKQEEN